MAGPAQKRHAPRPARRRLAPLAALVCALVTASVSGEGRLLTRAANATLGTSASSLQTLRINFGRQEVITANIVLAGQSRTLVLRPHSVRSAQFRVLVQSDVDGPLVAVEPPPARTYRGSIVQRPGAVVSATLVDGALTATIRDGSTVWGVQPATRLGLSALPGDHVVYRAADWTNPKGNTCGTPHGLGVAGRAETAEMGIAGGSTGLVSAEIAIDTDVELFQLNGSSIADTVTDVESILGAVELVYDRDAEIRYEITTIVVRTIEPDPYGTSDIESLFCEFRTRWNTGPESAIQRDVAHLFTGKELDGSKIGLARLATVCNVSMIDPFGCPGGNANLAYGLSQSHFTEAMTARVALTAHELAHNFNATHCDGQIDCHIMCSTLGACAGIESPNLRFGASARAAITSFRNSRGCLGDVLEPQTLPFVDTFPSTAVDASKWSYNDGAQVTAAAIAEPSEPWSLFLAAADDGAFGDQEIRSNLMELERAEGAVCSYYTQHRGVEAGEALDVEYWSSGLSWKTLERIESDGADQWAFVPSVHTLPDDARHAEFRIRFRADVSSLDDHWYIDDVTVVETCDNDAVCQDDIFCNGVEVCVGGFCEHGPGACAVDADCEEGLLACRDVACPAPQVLGATNRYLSILAPESAAPVAIVVAPACDTGTSGFVAQPSPEGYALLVDEGPQVARMPTAAWNGVVHVAGVQIVPGTNYLVWTECNADNPRLVSSPAGSATTIWGDVVGSFQDNAWTAPDNVVNVTTDVIAIIRAFQRDPAAPLLREADLLGINAYAGDCAPDLAIDLVDVLQAISGFQGVAYAVATSCPDPCQGG